MHEPTLPSINGDDEVINLSPRCRCPKAENLRSETKASLKKLLRAKVSDAKEFAALRRLLQNGVSLGSGSLAIRDLFSLSDHQLQKVNQNRILRSLKFEMMDERYLDVSEAADQTFSWILLDPAQQVSTHTKLQISFQEWLASGSGIFHICGKPGSGKSTLMKFICEHSQTT
jgi:hypothetical protein